MVKLVKKEIDPIWSALWEAVKLPLRLLVLAVIPFLIAIFTQLPYGWAGIITVILAIIDSFLHELWKITRGEEAPKGIIPF